MTSLNAEEFSSGMIKFTQEAEFISRFSESSEILGIHDVFRQNGTAYYTMDYIKGVSLKDYSAVLRESALPQLWQTLPLLLAKQLPQIFFVNPITRIPNI